MRSGLGDQTENPILRSSKIQVETRFKRGGIISDHRLKFIDLGMYLFTFGRIV